MLGLFLAMVTKALFVICLQKYRTEWSLGQPSETEMRPCSVRATSGSPTKNGSDGKTLSSRKSLQEAARVSKPLSSI